MAVQLWLPFVAHWPNGRDEEIDGQRASAVVYDKARRHAKRGESDATSLQRIASQRSAWVRKLMGIEP